VRKKSWLTATAAQPLAVADFATQSSQTPGQLGNCFGIEREHHVDSLRVTSILENV
jgi:hypothetical protein